MTITLPSIHIPKGAEAEAVHLFRSLKGLFQFTGTPSVVTDSGIRTVATGLEHSLEVGAQQIEEASTKPQEPA